MSDNSDSKYGIVLKKRDTLFWLDIEGKELGKYRASIVVPISDSLVCVRKNSQLEIYNRLESRLSKKIDADSLLFSNESYLIIRKDSQYAVFDIALNLILPFQNRQLIAIQQDKIFYSSKGKQGLIYNSGEEFISSDFIDLKILDSNFLIGYKKIDSVYYKAHLINFKTGKTIAIYDEIIGRPCAMFQLGDYYNIMWPELWTIGQSQYTYAANKFFIVGNGGIHGIIDHFGNLLIPIEYESIEQYAEDLLILKKDKKYGIYQLGKNLPIELKYDYIETYSPFYLICKVSDKEFDLINSDKFINIKQKYKFTLEPIDSNIIHGSCYRCYPKGDFLFNTQSNSYYYLNIHAEQFEEEYIKTSQQINRHQKEYKLQNFYGDVLYSGSSQMEIGTSFIFSIKNDTFFILNKLLEIVHSVPQAKAFIELDRNHIAIKIDTSYHLFNIEKKSFIGMKGNYFYFMAKYLVRESEMDIDIYDMSYAHKATVKINDLKALQQARFYSSANYISKEIRWSFDKRSAFEEVVNRIYYRNLVWEKLKSNK
ncbi:MAG: WG repeat-containing protein [Chitinophagales bacterium]